MDALNLKIIILDSFFQRIWEIHWIGMFGMNFVITIQRIVIQKIAQFFG